MGRRSKQQRLSAAEAAQDNTDSGSGASSREDGSGASRSSQADLQRPTMETLRQGLGFPLLRGGAPYPEEPRGHHREGPFFGFVHDRDMAEHPSAFTELSDAHRDGVSPPAMPASWTNRPRLQPQLLPHAGSPYVTDDFGAGSHLGFLSDGGRDPSAHALAELAKENLILKNKLRAAIGEVSRLQEIVRQREMERGSTSCTSSSESKKSQSRYWTDEEHQLFLEGMQRYGPKDMKAIAKHVGTRSSTQVRTHAQKYFLKMARSKKRNDSVRSGGGGSGSSTNSAADESFNTTSNSDCYFSSYDALGGGNASVRWSSSPGENTSSGGDEAVGGRSVSQKLGVAAGMGESESGEGAE